MSLSLVSQKLFIFRFRINFRFALKSMKSKTKTSLHGKFSQLVDISHQFFHILWPVATMCWLQFKKSVNHPFFLLLWLVLNAKDTHTEGASACHAGLTSCSGFFLSFLAAQSDLGQNGNLEHVSKFHPEGYINSFGKTRMLGSIV